MPWMESSMRVVPDDPSATAADAVTAPFRSAADRAGRRFLLPAGRLPRPGATMPRMDQSVIAVTGMSCAHCADAVRSEIAKVPGVSTVDVASGEVRIAAESRRDPAAVLAAVETAGYELAASSTRPARWPGLSRTGSQHQNQRIAHGHAHGYLAARRQARRHRRAPAPACPCLVLVL